MNMSIHIVFRPIWAFRTSALDVGAARHIGAYIRQRAAYAGAYIRRQPANVKTT